MPNQRYISFITRRLGPIMSSVLQLRLSSCLQTILMLSNITVKSFISAVYCMIQAWRFHFDCNNWSKTWNVAKKKCFSEVKKVKLWLRKRTFCWEQLGSLRGPRGQCLSDYVRRQFLFEFFELFPEKKNKMIRGILLIYP